MNLASNFFENSQFLRFSPIMFYITTCLKYRSQKIQFKKSHNVPIASWRDGSNLLCLLTWHEIVWPSCFLFILVHIDVKESRLYQNAVLHDDLHLKITTVPFTRYAKTQLLYNSPLDTFFIKPHSQEGDFEKSKPWTTLCKMILKTRSLWNITQAVLP